MITAQYLMLVVGLVLLVSVALTLLAHLCRTCLILLFAQEVASFPTDVIVVPQSQVTVPTLNHRSV